MKSFRQVVAHVRGLGYEYSSKRARRQHVSVWLNLRIEDGYRYRRYLTYGMHFS